ncbi:MAG: hypothetical protein ACLROE_07990 [Collinsella intestinalis]|uniref:hypothetical protein n=1 Tax=Collinsella intestinalis TaxID=147207 RepID=UPI0012EC9C32
MLLKHVSYAFGMALELIDDINEATDEVMVNGGVVREGRPEVLSIDEGKAEFN